MANLNLSAKTIDLLKFAGMPFNAARWERYEELVTKYGRKPVERKLDELSRRDYIDHGTSPRGGWLTTKGQEALAAYEAPHDPLNA